jgi:hypothetical protein
MPRFHVGQIMHLIADRRARTRDTYEVKRMLPSDGEPQYRIGAMRPGNRPAWMRRAGVTFKECARRYIAGHEAAWRKNKHRAQWRATLET